RATDAGDKLTDTELFDTVFGIFSALATTPRTSAAAIHELFSSPAQLHALRDDPTLLSDAVEECLRIANNTVFTIPRFATRDTEIAGVRILKGMVVRPSPQASNYDPDVYPDPLRFDIRRKPRRIMAFGVGPHQCLGGVLARRTIGTAIGRLMARFPEARMADP